MIAARTIRGLPEFLQERGGDKAVDRVFTPDAPPIEHLVRQSAYVVEQDILGLLERAARQLGEPDLGLAFGQSL